MSKGIKRQRKLEDMLGTSSSTKKRKGSQIDTAPAENTTVVSKKTKTTSSAPKISEEDLQLLRHFDLDMTFGPCTGIPRLDRYERALRHELEPPVRVLELVQLYPNDREVTHNIWRDYTL